MKFGMLTVTGKAPSHTYADGSTAGMSYCKCDCGTENVLCWNKNLTNGTKYSCGCARYENLIGKVFGRLTVVNLVEKSKWNDRIWDCDCECGNKNIKVCGASLKAGLTQSCGCLMKEKRYIATKKYNKYDLTGEYGIGYTFKGEEFYFDLEDYDLIKEYCWFLDSKGYVMAADIHNPKHTVFFHDIVMHTKYVDHIGGNTSITDNRKNNLRTINNSFASYNDINRGIDKRNTSGVKGVYRDKKSQKWIANITKDGKQIYLGSYSDINDAEKARKDAEDQYFGEWAYHISQKLSIKNSL